MFARLVERVRSLPPAAVLWRAPLAFFCCALGSSPLLLAAVLWRVIRTPRCRAPGSTALTPCCRLWGAPPHPSCRALWSTPQTPCCCALWSTHPQTPCCRALESTPSPPVAVRVLVSYTVFSGACAGPVLMLWGAFPYPLQPCSGEHRLTPCSRPVPPGTVIRSHRTPEGAPLPFTLPRSDCTEYIRIS